jgi:hypothetical protein
MRGRSLHSQALDCRKESIPINEKIHLIIIANDQIWRVATSFVNTSKVVKLPNPHNGNYEEMRSESLNPERRK